MGWVKFEPMPQAHLNQTSAIKMEGDTNSPVLTAYNLLGLVDPWKLNPIGCPETSARNYHYTLRNNPEAQISAYNLCGKLVSKIVSVSTAESAKYFALHQREPSLAWIVQFFCCGKHGSVHNRLD